MENYATAGKIQTQNDAKAMEDSQLLDEVASIFSNAENSVFGMLSGKDVDTTQIGRAHV